jgi:hypothetical protein
VLAAGLAAESSFAEAWQAQTQAEFRVVPEAWPSVAAAANQPS